jgi:hypothetical protein
MDAFDEMGKPGCASFAVLFLLFSIATHGVVASGDVPNMLNSVSGLLTTEVKMGNNARNGNI